MNLRGLAEAIILQSLEDLWSIQHREGSIRFFGGAGFGIAAEMAGLGFNERLKILGLVKEFFRGVNISSPSKKAAGGR